LKVNPGAIRIAFAGDLGGFAPVETEIGDALQDALAEVAGDGIAVEEACPDLSGLHEIPITLRGSISDP